MSTRIAVVDLGSNSTRLLVADLDPDGAIDELERRSTVTRLGQGVDTAHALAPEAMERVYATLTSYRQAIDELHADVAIGVLTSAVRDAANGAQFTATVRERFGIAARTIPGEEEARLTYLGATSERTATEPTAVIDVGGGSTEVVVGAGSELRFHVSTQVGVVRHSERHLHDDPPGERQLRALREDAAATFAQQVPQGLGARAGIAVAGTATQSAAMLGAPDLQRDALEELLERLAAMALEQRCTVPGLDPDRAPTIVAGVAVLLEAMSALGLGAVEASDHDILRGAVLEHTVFES
ncbi:MAG: Ppx/GppA phosphatase [Solirubrobacteraceae bacterium]|nr:Ppx/GppA phosphatase [Solirubrobacteraceae bacterium]